MRARGAHRVRAHRRGGTVRWRRVVIITVAAALPLTVVAAAAQPASAAGGYTVTATIGVGSDPQDVAVNPAAGIVYVTNTDDDTVSVIDAATKALTATIPVGSNPDGVAVDPTRTMATRTQWRRTLPPGRSMCPTTIVALCRSSAWPPAP